MRRRLWLVSVSLRLILGILAGPAGASMPRPWVLEQKLEQLSDRAADEVEFREGTTEVERVLGALPSYERLLKERVRTDGPWSLAVGRIHARLGRLSWKLNRREQAQEHLGRAAEILKAQLGSDRAETQEVLSDYAEAMRRRTYGGRAEPRLREAWHAVEKATGPYGEEELPDHQARRAEQLGQEYFRSGRLDRAEAMYQRALREWLPLLGPAHPRVIRTRWRMARIARLRSDPHQVSPALTTENIQEFWARCERLDWIVGQGSPAHE